MLSIRENEKLNDGARSEVIRFERVVISALQPHPTMSLSATSNVCNFESIAINNAREMNVSAIIDFRRECGGYQIAEFSVRPDPAISFASHLIRSP
jgi:hypothetical protein